MKDSINKNYAKTKKSLDINFDELLSKIISGDVKSLSKAITLVENSNLQFDEDLLRFLTKLPENENSTRIAITGPPGAGKSTFIESLGIGLVHRGYKVAVLAVDPSSEKTKGSILGDKTRMEGLSKQENAFIRPSSNRLEAGGIRMSTNQTIKLCEAAGFDFIFIETVGVGQSEIEVSKITDIVLLLLSPFGGDELQGIKKGIVESADLIVFNKIDAVSKSAVDKMIKEYKQAIHLVKNKSAVLDKIEILSASALEGTGIERIVEFAIDFHQSSSVREKIGRKRAEQQKIWMKNAALDMVQAKILNSIFFQNKLAEMRQQKNSFKALLDFRKSLSSIDFQ